MTKEEKFVINPILKWFKGQTPNWKLRKPRYGTAATGWDIEARRKNQDLLIEAKYINGPFLASFGGLVTAPLANRRQYFMKRKYRSWSYGVCWAIGTSYATRNVLQIMFDYLSRNQKFWEAYGELLKMKYIFFVDKKVVSRVSWKKFLELSKEYSRLTNKKTRLVKRRRLAKELMEKSIK